MLKTISDLSTIGGRIKYYRLANGLLQEDVATKTGLDVCTIKRYENNLIKHSIEICNKISGAIGVDPYLIYDDYLRFLASGYGEKIKDARKKLKLTQKEFGKILNVHRKTITRWEKEKMQPSREYYNLLKNHL